VRGGLRALLPALIVCGIAGAPPAGGLADPAALVPVERPVVTARIGVMGPLSGPAAGYGRSQLDGVTLAAEEVNAQLDAIAATALRLRVELVPVDDRADMSGAGDRLVRLIYEERVHAIVGAINSAVTHVVQMVTAKAHVPMITTTSTDPSITRSGSFYTFRCLADDLLQGKALARRVYEVDGHRRVALLRQDNRYGRMGGAEIARIGRERGAPMVLDLLFDGEAERFDVQVAALRDAAPDALVIWGLYTPGARLVRAIRGAGLRLSVYGADGLVHPEFLRLAGDAAEGALVTLPFNPCRDDPITRGFLARFRARYGREADSFAAHSYDALMLIVAAIRRAGGVDPERIKDELLLTRRHPGVTGRITLDETGNDTREVELARVVDGAFAPLTGGDVTGTRASPGSRSRAGPSPSGWVSCPAAPGTR
jgi:branched-chain amino acid transport system substrate-binding protein